MEEIFGLLCVLFFALAIVAVVGHFLWWLTAAFIRWLSGSLGATEPPLDQRVADVEATVRELNRLHSDGLIEADLHSRLMRLVGGSKTKAAREETPPAHAVPPAPAAPSAMAQPAAEDVVVIEAVVVEEPSPERSATERSEVCESPSVESRSAPVPPVETTPAPISHALDRDYAETPSAPSAARRTLADLLKAFMAEKNIRWGELVSGMLIVGSAVGLVISLRATLSETIPYFPALIFMAITLAIHGAGMYTLRRWNLRTTSRAVLIIALLLTPFVFLSAIIMSGPVTEGLETDGGGAAAAIGSSDDSSTASLQHLRSVTDPAYILAVIVGVLCSGWITFSAGRALLLEGWWRLAAAVLATSVGQLIIDRSTPADPSLTRTFLLVALPVFGYLAATLTQVSRATGWRRLSARRAEQIFVVLGVSTIALLVPLGLFVSHCDSIRDAFARLAPSTSLCAAAVLATGLLVHRRVSTRQLAAMRTAGTALGVTGAMLMGTAVFLAWPQPNLLIAVGLANFVVLVVLALAGRLPVLHTSAVSCLALAVLVSFHDWQGNLPDAAAPTSRQLLDWFLAARSSIVLSVLAILSAGVSLALYRFRRPRDAAAYLQGCGGLAAVSILISMFAGFGPGGDTALATPIFAFYAVGALGAAIVACAKKGAGPICRDGPENAAHLTPSSLLSWTGIALLLTALVHGLWLNEPLRQWLAERGLEVGRPVLSAAILHANLCALMALAVSWKKLRTPETERNTPLWLGLVKPLSWSALAISTLAVPSALWVRDQMFATHAVYFFGIALAWLIVAVILRWPTATAVVQGLTTIGVAFLVAAVCQNCEWPERWWIDPRHIQAQLAVLAAWGAGWSAARRLTVHWPIAKQIVRPAWPTVDEVVLGGLVAVLLILSTVACWPGLLVEMGVVDSLPTDGVYHLAYAAGSWIALALIVVALLMSLWERFTEWALGGVLLAAAAIPLLVSAPFEASGATASAMRWSFGIYTIIGAVAVWMRVPICHSVRRLHWLGWDEFPSWTDRVARETALLIGGMPVVLITTILACRAMVGLPPTDPVEDSLFGRLDTTVSYAGPLLMLVAVLVGHALRERSATYALAGSVVLQYVVSLAYLLGPWTGQPEFWAGLLQWNATALAGYTLVWLALDRRIHRQSEVRTFLAIQMSAMGLAIGLLATWCAVSVFVTPGDSTAYEQPLGRWLSYVAWGLGLISAVWFAVRRPMSARADDLDKTPIRVLKALGSRDMENLLRQVAWLVVALIAVVATSVDPRDAARDWLAYHLLTCGWLAAATGLTAAAWRWRGLWRDAAIVGGLVVLLATRGGWSDPHRLAPWWSVGAAATAAVLAGTLSVRLRSQLFAYASMVSVGLASTFYWIGPFLGRWVRDEGQAVAELWQANLISVVLVAGFWLAVELWFQRRSRRAAFSPDFRFARVHVLVALLGTVFATMLIVGSFGVNCIAREASGGAMFDIAGTGGPLVLGTLGVLLAGSLWDRRANWAMATLYVWGALVIALALDALQLNLEQAFHAVGMSAAGYVALTGVMWRQGARLASVGDRWGVPHAIDGLKRTAGWLPVINMLVAAGVMLIGLVVVLFFDERWMRIGSGFSPVLLAVGLGALAQKERRGLLQFMSLLMTGAAAIYLSWADLTPEWSDEIALDFTIRLLIVLSGLTFVYGVVVVRFVSPNGDWMPPVRRVATTFGIGAIMMLLGVLMLEAIFFEPKVGAPVDAAETTAVSVVLVALIAGLISLALLPGRDPLALTEKGRMGYVYAAEVVGALLFAHVYFCVPDLFTGRLQAYWPYIVMAIAFAGVGVGELFHRRGVRVLSEPLQRSGAFLPLVPAIGVWIIAADKTDYSTLLFLIGLMYLILSILRRSVAAGLLAAVAANGALWSLLSENGLMMWRNPQFWLIPPAASVLIAGQINRNRLGAGQLAALRYASILVIYLSSTSEIFIRGVGQSLWPPIILATLAVAGVFLGIMLRVRAFLYLGSSFVLLSIVSMVWHARVAIDHTWPWWAFLIGLGICILVFFGALEKRRSEIMRWIEHLQQWEE